MELRPPRWLTPVLGLVAVGLLAGGVAVAVAGAGGPWGSWLVAGLLVWGGATALAIAVIGTRAVMVADRRVEVTGVRGRAFDGDELIGPLDQRLLGVRLADGTATRRVFAQLPHLTASLVERLPGYFPQLRSPTAFPVVLPGRISTPVAYGVVAALMAGMGSWATVEGVRAPASDGPNRVLLLVIGVPMLVLGAGTVWWVARRAERRVEIHADRVDRVHLLGRRSRPLPPLAAAVVVRSPRKLPKSTLEREVHHLRLIGTDASTVELAPMLAAFPDYGAAEGQLMEGRARALHRLHDLPHRPVAVYRTPIGEIALWDHSESSPSAHRHTLLLPWPVGGKRVVPVPHGRLAVGGSIADAVASYDDRMLVLLDLRDREVRHASVDSPIRELDPGFRRVVTADGPVDLHALADASSARWPRTWGPLGVPNTPWIPGLDGALAELDRFDDTRRDDARELLVARAHEALIALLVPTGEEPAPRVLAPVIEMARLEDPHPRDHVQRFGPGHRARPRRPPGVPRLRRVDGVADRAGTRLAFAAGTLRRHVPRPDPAAGQRAPWSLPGVRHRRPAQLRRSGPHARGDRPAEPACRASGHATRPG